MRIHSTLLTTLFAVFIFITPALATPSGTGDELDKYVSDTGLMANDLMAKIDQVRQSVGMKASELVFTAMGFLGVPYRRGGSSIETGFDCSGFVRAMYQQTVGLILPRKAEQQAAVTDKIARADLQPGDLVFFNTMRRAFSHVGIYIGEGKFIHSPKPGSEVRVEDMDISYWSRRFDGARRVPSASPEAISSQFRQPIDPSLR